MKTQLDVSSDTDIVIRRHYSHAPARVWRALTEPALIRQWLTKDDLARCEIDVRPGGSFHYEWPAFSFFGPILSVDAPHRLSLVEHFSLEPSYRVEVTTELTAQDSGTRMTVVMRYPTAAARTAAIAAGFTDGLDEVYGRLEGLQIPA